MLPPASSIIQTLCGVVEFQELADSFALNLLFAFQVLLQQCYRLQTTLPFSGVCFLL